MAAEELPAREVGRPPVEHQGAWLAQEGSPGGGSYKERGAEVLAAVAAQRGLREVFLDSSGNAGLAVAAACAARGIRCRVLVPESTPQSKRQAIEAAGGALQVVAGDRAATFRAAQELRGELPYASHIFQPAFVLGVATLAWELEHRLAESLPRRWLLPAGNGALLLGLWLGLRALQAAGRLTTLPQLWPVQLEGYAALHPQGPGSAAPGSPTAAGIAIASPARRREMQAVVEASGGAVTRVSEEQIGEARRRLAEQGFAADPTGAAAWAGYRARPELAGAMPLVVITSRSPE
jgi:threonine synthase